MPHALNGRKVCSKCRIEKPVEEFSVGRKNPDGLAYQCKSCRGGWYRDNVERVSLKHSVYRLSHQKETAIWHAEWWRNRWRTDPLFRFTKRVRNLVRGSFRGRGFRKNTKTANILGVSTQEFQDYIQAKFKPGWTFADQGVKWDLDHIVPVSTAETIEDVIRLNHYTNFQPLECHINRYVKRDRLDWESET